MGMLYIGQKKFRGLKKSGGRVKKIQRGAKIF